MEQKTSLKMILIFMFATATIVLTMLALVPFLNEAFAVEVSRKEVPTVTEAPVPGAPEELLLTAVYEMEENSKKINAIHIEVFLVGSNTVTCFEVPADTKVMLSEDLYKSLQTYAPELPQYLKLSNMAEGFSTEYSLTGCNRILSEVLGISVNEYVRADRESITYWYDSLAEEKTADGFFEDYSKWLEFSPASLTTEERWIYYESWKKVNAVLRETAPGSQEKDGYMISGKRSRERLQELMLRKEAVTEQQQND